MMRLRLSTHFSLPLDVVTQTIAALAKRRAGKSYTIAKIVEELFRAKQQVVIVDPKGDWWGIRSSADGKGSGLPVIILGGSHGDVPLEPGSGELVGRMIVEERVSLLLDLSDLRKGQVPTFMAPLLETVYRLKAKDEYRTAMMLVVDEADAIAPQRPFKGEERMLGAAEDIVRRGGQRGIGCIMATQRAAVLNKNVLTQSQILIALRLIAPQDRDALEAWIEVHGTESQKATLMESLGSLPTGTAWFWSPGWPDAEGIFERVEVGRRTTFDSFRTPAPGEKRIEPKTLADVDLESLKKRMAATIERVKADDPRELRREIADLRRQLASKLDAKPSKVDTKVTTLEIPVIRPRELKALKRSAAHLQTVWSRFETAKADLFEQSARLLQLVDGRLKTFVPKAEAQRQIASVARPPVAPRHSGNSGDAEGDRLSASQQRILDALAWLEAIGLTPANKTQVALLADQSPTSGGYFNNLGKLRSSALIVYPAPSTIALTEIGRTQARTGDNPTTSEELHAQLFRRLSRSQAAILQQVIERYPKDIGKDELAEKAGQSPTSGGYFNNLGRLRSLGVIDYPSTKRVVACPVLFLEGR